MPPLSALDLPLEVLDLVQPEADEEVPGLAAALLAARRHLGPELAGDLAQDEQADNACVAASTP